MAKIMQSVVFVCAHALDRHRCCWCYFCVLFAFIFKNKSNPLFLALLEIIITIAIKFPAWKLNSSISSGYILNVLWPKCEIDVGSSRLGYCINRKIKHLPYMIVQTFLCHYLCTHWNRRSQIRWIFGGVQKLTAATTEQQLYELTRNWNGK